jgi:nucleotide-binding universal stress UspA family protein
MAAVRQAARLAASVGADLLLVHVLDTGRTVDVGVDVEGDAERTLDAGGAIARSLDVVPDARVLSGDPSDPLDVNSLVPAPPTALADSSCMPAAVDARD